MERKPQRIDPAYFAHKGPDRTCIAAAAMRLKEQVKLRRPGDQLQLLRAQHHPRQQPAGAAHERLAGRAEDHLLRALKRHRHCRMRVVPVLTAESRRAP